MRLIVFQTTKESQDHWNSLPFGALVVVVVSRKKEKERRVQVDNHYY
jgi:hypothetical protein